PRSSRDSVPSEARQVPTQSLRIQRNLEYVPLRRSAWYCIQNAPSVSLTRLPATARRIGTRISNVDCEALSWRLASQYQSSSSSHSGSSRRAVTLFSSARLRGRISAKARASAAARFVVPVLHLPRLGLAQ